MKLEKGTEHSVEKYLERQSDDELKGLLLYISAGDDSEGYDYARKIILEILRSRNCEPPA